LQEESSEESLLANIVSKVPFIKKPNTIGYTPKEVFSLVDLVKPLDTNFGLYLGSQTHPPCTTGVRWLVARNSIPVGTEDVRSFVLVIGLDFT
jgi:carbonic anhydrase